MPINTRMVYPGSSMKRSLRSLPRKDYKDSVHAVVPTTEPERIGRREMRRSGTAKSSAGPRSSGGSNGRLRKVDADDDADEEEEEEEEEEEYDVEEEIEEEKRHQEEEGGNSSSSGLVGMGRRERRRHGLRERVQPVSRYDFSRSTVRKRLQSQAEESDGDSLLAELEENQQNKSPGQDPGQGQGRGKGRRKDKNGVRWEHANGHGEQEEYEKEERMEEEEEEEEEEGEGEEDYPVVRPQRERKTPKRLNEEWMELEAKQRHKHHINQNQRSKHDRDSSRFYSREYLTGRNSEYRPFSSGDVAHDRAVRLTRRNARMFGDGVDVDHLDNQLEATGADPNAKATRSAARKHLLQDEFSKLGEDEMRSNKKRKASNGREGGALEPNKPTETAGLIDAVSRINNQAADSVPANSPTGLPEHLPEGSIRRIAFRERTIQQRQATLSSQRPSAMSKKKRGKKKGVRKMVGHKVSNARDYYTSVPSPTAAYSLRDRAKEKETPKYTEKESSDSELDDGRGLFRHEKFVNRKAEAPSPALLHAGSSEDSDALPSAAATPQASKKNREFPRKSPSRSTALRGPSGAGPSDFNADTFRPAISRLEKEKSRSSSVPKGVQSGFAAVEPVILDTTLGWDALGGLDKHVQCLKEMVYLPLMYPELFERFKMEPPKGVLFYGPPGTGKTLCARALAASCKAVARVGPDGTVTQQPKVSFFMRNGADVLSKWVGEAERNLRMTFEAAKQHQPAIIFFDEIDGLAPVRSSRQDQIHSSIVSTLLGLMDGLEARGKIVVIGATNRIDSIDPALRRPGRFDRELIFTLPNAESRLKILQIHTKAWDPRPLDSTLSHIAKKTVGYGGADLQSLCAEAALCAVRRLYPQVYLSQEKLMVDPSKVVVVTRDFVSAMSRITASGNRSMQSSAEPLRPNMKLLLHEVEDEMMQRLREIFPQGFVNGDNNSVASIVSDAEMNALLEDQDAFFEHGALAGSDSEFPNPLIELFWRPPASKARMLIAGPPRCGQYELAKAALHGMDGCTIFDLGMNALHASANGRPMEEIMTCVVRDAKRACPSVLFLPHLDTWLSVATESMKATLTTMLQEIASNTPIMVLATIECSMEQFSGSEDLFNELSDRFQVCVPDESSRRRFFEPILQALQEPALPRKDKQKERMLQPLALAPASEVVVVTEDQENLQQEREEEVYLRQLRIEIREFLSRIIVDRRFKMFSRPVDPEDAPDYYDIIRNPIDLSMISQANDNGKYMTLVQMVQHIDILVRNAIDYNPPHTEEGALILRRAHALMDFTHAWADSLDSDLVKECNKIYERRLERKKKQEEHAALLAAENVAERDDPASRRLRSGKTIRTEAVTSPQAPDTRVQGLSEPPATSPVTSPGKVAIASNVDKERADDDAGPCVEMEIGSSNDEKDAAVEQDVTRDTQEQLRDSVPIDQAIVACPKVSASSSVDILPSLMEQDEPASPCGQLGRGDLDDVRKEEVAANGLKTDATAGLVAEKLELGFPGRPGANCDEITKDVSANSSVESRDVIEPIVATTKDREQVEPTLSGSPERSMEVTSAQPAVEAVKSTAQADLVLKVSPEMDAEGTRVYLKEPTPVLTASVDSNGASAMSMDVEVVADPVDIILADAENDVGAASKLIPVQEVEPNFYPSQDDLADLMDAMLEKTAGFNVEALDITFGLIQKILYSNRYNNHRNEVLRFISELVYELDNMPVIVNSFKK